MKFIKTIYLLTPTKCIALRNMKFGGLVEKCTVNMLRQTIKNYVKWNERSNSN